MAAAIPRSSPAPDIAAGGSSSTARAVPRRSLPRRLLPRRSLPRRLFSGRTRVSSVGQLLCLAGSLRCSAAWRASESTASGRPSRRQRWRYARDGPLPARNSCWPGPQVMDEPVMIRVALSTRRRPGSSEILAEAEGHDRRSEAGPGLAAVPDAGRTGLVPWQA